MEVIWVVIAKHRLCLLYLKESSIVGLDLGGKHLIYTKQTNQI